MPLLARTLNWPRSPASAWVSSVHTPVALTTCWARTSNALAATPGRAPARRRPARPPAAARRPGPAVGDVGAVGGGGAGDEHRVPRVVDLGVVVLQRADQRVLPQRRDDPQRAAAGEVAVVRHAPRPARQQAERVVERDARARVEPLPAAVHQRVEERHRLDEVRGELLDQQPALLQRLGDQPEVEHLQVAQAAVDRACWSGWTCRRRSRGPRRGRRSGRGWRRRARTRRRPHRRRRPGRPARRPGRTWRRHACPRSRRRQAGAVERRASSAASRVCGESATDLMACPFGSTGAARRARRRRPCPRRLLRRATQRDPPSLDAR